MLLSQENGSIIAASDIKGRNFNINAVSI